ncbi:MAG: tetratricopeptide repeat protein [Bryobacteraceae bacterium]
MPFAKVAERAGAVVLCAVWLSAAALTKTGPTLTRAEDLYWHTQYEASLALLDKDAADAPTTFLIGRNYLMSGDPKKATEYLQKAVAADPRNSDYIDWLGRAYGRRAETSNPVMAPMLASKARQAFERSVALDPKNAEALSDLFAYYLEAPGFLGGGYDKAFAVAKTISAVNPAEGYFAKAQLAKKRREFNEAEQHLRQAAALAPQQVGRLIDLARLLADEGRTRESDAVFAQAQKLDPNAPKVWFARARTLIKQKRNFEEAKNLLQKYMRASITADDPPKNDALDLLRQVGGA